MIELEEPKDVRALIKAWIAEICDTGKLPFAGGGTVVQLLNVWLRSYEIEKVTDLEERVKALEEQKIMIIGDSCDKSE